MDTLVDLVNHGILPFVGREDESARLVRFWRETLDAQGLRAFLVVGEAGVGKSRLAAHIEKLVAEGKGAVVHARLYPESSTSIAPILAEAIASADADLRLLRSDPEGNIGDVAAALRRLCRLRPTLVIIEDVHLLEGEALRETARLLGSLTDETLSLLCFARPVELPVRSVLQPWLVQEMMLEGLGRAELSTLWTDLFGGASPNGELARLRQVTRGNPLALRTVLRALLPASRDRLSTDLVVNEEMLGAALDRNVDLLSEGMVAHLTDEERLWSERLAALGEVFSRSAAQSIVEQADEVIERLLFGGIIARPIAPPASLQGTSAPEDLFAFTHSLLHDYLIGRGNIDVTALVRAIVAGVPLYSFVPLTIIQERGEELTLESSEIEWFVDRMRTMVSHLITTPDWRIALRACDAADRLVAASGGVLDTELRATLELEVRSMRISTFLRNAFSQPDELARLLDPLLTGTVDPTSPKLGELRIFALHHALYLTVIRSWETSFDTEREEYWQEIHAIVDRWPELRASRTYALALIGTAQAAGARNLARLKEMVEEKLDEIDNDASIDADLRRQLREKALVFFVNDFTSVEERDLRMRQLEELEESPYVDRPSLMIRRLAIMTQTGWVDKAMTTIENALPYFERREQHRNAFSTRINLLACRGLLGEDLDDIAREAEQMLTAYNQPTSSGARELVGSELSSVGFLRLDLEWLSRFLEAYADTHYGDEFRATLRLLSMLDEDPLAGLELHAERNQDWLGVVDAIRTGAFRDERAQIATIEGVFDGPILRLIDVANRLQVLLLLTEATALHSGTAVATEIDQIIRRHLLDILTWLRERDLAPSILAVVKRFGRHFSKKELTTWRGRAGVIEKRRKEEREARERRTTKIRLTMFGTIQATLPSAEIVPIRGARLSTMLALMAVDRMLKEPLGTREFRHLAAGGEEDPEHARKTMNAAVFRLRDLLGVESILTDEETPRLNLEAVDVDIVTADRLLRDAAEALRDGSLLRARSALLDALELARGDVPFPSLYEEMFEAAREDFEFRLRDSILKVSKRLLREEDMVSAEEILRRSLAFMPEDEEVAEMLCELLEQTGRQIESRRIRMRMEMEVE